MTTPVGILWALLSIMVAGTCSFSFLQPFWFIEPNTYDSFGMYSYCVAVGGGAGAPRSGSRSGAHSRSRAVDRAPSHVCGIYGGSFHFSNLPSNSWQAACVLYGGGCAFLCLGALFAITALCIPQLAAKRLSVLTGYVQTMAVLILIAGLLVFPLGLSSRFVQHYCRGARVYWAGACHLGWGYMLGIMGCALAMFCPFLSQYTDMKVQDPPHTPHTFL